MNSTKQLSKTLLATSIAAAIALVSTAALAQPEYNAPSKTYTDPITGELKVAPKLLSEMTEAEKAALNQDETKVLEEIEAQIKKEQKEQVKE